MKKTISINIGGMLFHVEEDGYEQLKNYLAAIQRYFVPYGGSAEIIADIEGRVAELLTARLAEGRAVVTGEDVAAVVAKMGSVSDFAAAADAEDFARPNPANDPAAAGDPADGAHSSSAGSTGANPTGTYAAAPPFATEGPRRLYRDMRRKLVGGVAAGLAHFVRLDPLWVRLGLIVGFFGLLFVPPAGGFVVVLYAILWLVTPGSFELEEDIHAKKLYRNNDDRVIGGVASGVAAYFHVDVTTARIFFILSMFFFGQGLILYLALWAITPTAKTFTERMEMKGEPVTLSNININLKKDQPAAAPENTFTRLLLAPFRAVGIVFNALGGILAPLFRFGGDAIRTLTGLFMIFLALTIGTSLVATLGAALGWFRGDNRWLRLGNFPVPLLQNSFPESGFVFAFLAVVIPVVFLGAAGLALVSRRNVLRGGLGWTLFLGWVVSVVGTGVTAAAVVSDFQTEGRVDKKQILAVNGRTLALRTREVGENYRYYHGTQLRLEGYDGTQPTLTQQFQARGFSRTDALANTESVTYAVTQADSVITFDDDVTFRPNAAFRAQELQLTLQLPFEQTFTLDELTVGRLLRNTNILPYGQYADESLADKLLKFTKDGTLVCLTCQPKPMGTTTADDRRGEEGESVLGNIFDDDDFTFQGSFTKTFPASNFTKLDVGSAVIVTVTPGSTFAVTATGNRRDVDRLTVTTSGGTLEVGYEDDDNWLDGDHQRVRLNVVMPALREADFSGATHARVRGFTVTEPLEVRVSGASSVALETGASTLTASVSGASTLTCQGRADRLAAEVNGASTLNAFGLAAGTVVVDASGAGTARVAPGKVLNAEASGAAKVYFRGNPATLTKNESGAGSVETE